MSVERIRSFIAVDVDDQAILDRIVTAQRGLGETRAELKLVDPKIMHFTLRFLGEIPKTTVEGVTSVLDSLRFQSFQVDFFGLGAFPNMNRINVVWVGTRAGGEQLQAIFKEFEPKLRQLGLPPDDKGFSPHLTIARVRSGVNRVALADYVSGLKDQEFGSMRVDAVRLKRSTLTPKGPIYDTMHEVKATG